MATNLAMMKDNEHTMAIVVQRISSKGAVKTFDKDGNMIMNVTTSPVQENNELIEMLFLSSGCDALTLGQSLVKYIRKG